MANFRCKMCGAQLDVKEGQTVAVCAFCGSKQTVANADDERKENLFNRANVLRRNCEFDKAILTYQSIISLFPTEPEAYWGLCLCKYGIEYIDDPATNKKKPTIHRVSFESILSDSDYLSALAYADVIAKEEYQTEAKEIATIQNNILSISQKEEPFDIFICYKESDDNGKRTPDSVMAYEIYNALTEKGYKVFFSRVTLESKLGTMYEPYIFAALNTAKIMLVIGTRKEYFEAVWVKNEWSRFIDLMQTRPDHYLIPCYKDMDAYEMPEQFLSFQAQDLSKLGFMQDLMRGIDKIMGRDHVVPKTETRIIQTDVNISALLKRAEILIGDADYKKADSLLERVLDNDPMNSQAYLLKLVIDLNLRSVSELKNYHDPLDNFSNYKKALDFADDEQRKRIIDINEFIKNRNEEARLEFLYSYAMDCKKNLQYKKAEEAFLEIANYKDAKFQASECVRLSKENLFKKALYLKENKKYDEAIEILNQIADFKNAQEEIADCEELKRKEIYQQAILFMEQGDYDAASKRFAQILDYDDSEFQISECDRLKKEAQKEVLYQSCLFNREIYPRYDMPKIKKACKTLATISGYKDADQLLVNYENIINEYETLLIEKRKEKARAKIIRLKKAKKISIISGVAAIFLTITLLLTFLVFVPQGRINKIQSLIDNRLYKEASVLMDKNNSNEEYHDLRQMCKAGQAFDNLNYEVGIDYIVKIGGSVEVNYDGMGGTPNITYDVITPSNFNLDNSAYMLGYDFYGWKQTEYRINSKKRHANITLQAQYSPITYQISYDLNGGTLFPVYTSYTIENNGFKIGTPEKKGYTFTGWIGTELHGITKDVYISKGDIGNRHYIANYEANNYTINYDYGYENRTSSQNVEYDDECNLEQPTRDGYKFDGWYYNDKLYKNGVWTLTNDITLKAHWSLIDYKINYILNGGENNPFNPLNYNINSKSFTLLSPQKKGHDFLGWTGTNVSTMTKNVTIASGSTGNLTFTANWAVHNYHIFFDFNGGECATEVMDIDYNSYYSFPTPTKNGYTFAGWFDSDDNQLVPTSGTWLYLSDLSVYAKWNANCYTISYDLNNGTNHKDNPSSYTIEDDDITILNPTREGYTFTGWNSILGEQQFEPNISTSSLCDIHFTATWKANLNTIIFDGNGSTSGLTESMQGYTDSTITLNKNQFIRDGYSFAGWSETARGSVKYLDNESIVVPTNSIYTLYAIWTPNLNSIRFNGNGNDSGTMDNQNMYTDTTESLNENNFSKKGYHFVGWSTSKDGEVAYNDQGNYVMGSNSVNDLYAKWEPNNYKISFDTNGGSNTPSEATVTFDSDFSLEIPTRVGYYFSGWYLGNTQVTDVDGKSLNGYNIAGDITVVAHWSPKTNVIILINEDQKTTISAPTDSFVMLPENTISKEGYLFEGWSTTKNGVVEYKDRDLYKVPTSSSSTLYGIWEDYSDYEVIATKSDLSKIASKKDGKFYLSNDINMGERVGVE